MKLFHRKPLKSWFDGSVHSPKVNGKKYDEPAIPLESFVIALPEAPDESIIKRDFNLKKWMYLSLGLLACLATIWTFQPKPIAVDTAPVNRGELLVTVNAEGKTRVRDRYTISANVAGRLERVQLKEGDSVQAGAIIARIDPISVNSAIQQAQAQLAGWQAEREGVATQRPKVATLEQAQTRIRAAQANYRQTQAKVAEAQAMLEQAQRDRQRAQALEASGAIARQALETAELNEISQAKALETASLATKTALAEVEVATAAVTVLQQEQRDPDYLLKLYDARIESVSAELTKLQDDAQQTLVRSPVSGKVLKIRQQSTQYVAAGTPLLEIADPGQLELVIDVLSGDALKIQPDDPILVDRGAEAPPLQAKVQLIEPSAFTKVSALGVEEQRVNVIGDFVEAHRLGDAYRVDVQIVVWQGKAVLQVPLSALFRCNRSSWCTFVVKQGKAHQQRVSIGQRSELAAEIRQGLKPNDVVILHPSEQIKTGTQVSPR
jgi:HlyD family secretion protein